MTTFSQLVDELALEVGRPDMLANIAAYTLQTLRELHFKADSNAAIAYRENLRETIITATVESGYGWEIPNPEIFQTIAAVRYDSIFCTDEETRYVAEKHVGVGMANTPRFFYRAGSTVYFSGYGGVGARIAIAYYEYTRKLRYFEVANRPATYDMDLGWSYHASFSATPELQAAARAFTSNWLLMRWEEVVKEGVRAKIYKRLSDDARARTAYSLYSSLRQGLFVSETVTLTGR